MGNRSYNSVRTNVLHYDLYVFYVYTRNFYEIDDEHLIRNTEYIAFFIYTNLTLMKYFCHSIWH